MNKVIVHIPHSSTDIPEEYKKLFVVDDETLSKELLLMTDRYTDELFERENSIVFPVSRLVCDVERFRNEADEEMSPKGMWVCYEKTSDGKQLKICTNEHKNEILTRYYDVHHRKLTEAVELVLEEHGECIIIDAHSFSSTPLPHEPSHETPRPDICIGTDDFHTPYQLLEFCKDFFEAKGYSVAINQPFSGTVVPVDYYGKNKQVESVMIEINRNLYMDEQTGEKTDNFETIKQEVSELLIDLQNYRTICIIPAGTYIMASEPHKDWTPDDLKEWLKENQTEFGLAMGISISNNKWVWYAHDCDDEDGEQYIPIYDAWWELYKELTFRGFEILEKENASGVANHDLSDIGWYFKIKPLMERNGFIDGRGWWIYGCEND